MRTVKFYHDVKVEKVPEIEYVDIFYNKATFNIDDVLPHDLFVIRRGTKRINSKHWIKDTSLTKQYHAEYSSLYHKKTKTAVYIPRFPIAFDTETTTVTGDIPVVKDGELYTKKMTTGFVYYFILLIDKYVIHCRTWEDILTVFAQLQNKLRISSDTCVFSNTLLKTRVLIANLGFEFQFMRDRFPRIGHMWKKVFSVKSRTPLTAETDSGFVFQDALKISNSSLEKLSELYELPTKKTHDLDYSLMRNSKTPLDEKEIEYCSNDVRILGDFYRWIINNYVVNGLPFPLTSTGLVRDSLKKFCKMTEIKTRKADNGKTYRNQSRFIKTVLPNLFPKSYNEYAEDVLHGFRGGYTHANYTIAGRTIFDVNGGDFTSSYPYCLLFQKFPMSAFTESQNNTWDTLCKIKKQGKAILAKVTFHGLTNKTPHSLESVSKTYEWEQCGRSLKKYVQENNAIIDNGRILYTDNCTVIVTDLDIDSYDKFYNYDSVEVHYFKFAQYNYLPDYVRMCVIQYYQIKSVLKDKGLDETTDYRIAKAMLNAIYGMMCEKLHIDNTIYDPETKQWTKELPQTMEELESAYQECIGKQNDDFPTTILSPYWGMWTTSHARHNLFDILLELPSEDSLYCDTDSIYFTNPEKNQAVCDKYNKRVMEENSLLIDKWNKEHGFDIDVYNSKTDKDKTTYLNETHGMIPKMFIGLGAFDKLHKGSNYTRFKTLGAKRYIKSYMENGKEVTVQTIAGLPKESLMNYLSENMPDTDPYDFFQHGMTIPKVKNCSFYCDDEIAYEVTDYLGNSEIMHEYSAIGIKPIDFTMKLSSEYFELINKAIEEIKKKDLRKCVLT